MAWTDVFVLLGGTQSLTVLASLKEGHSVTRSEWKKTFFLFSHVVELWMPQDRLPGATLAFTGALLSVSLTWGISWMAMCRRLEPGRGDIQGMACSVSWEVNTELGEADRGG